MKLKIIAIATFLAPLCLVNIVRAENRSFPQPKCLVKLEQSQENCNSLSASLSQKSDSLTEKQQKQQSCYISGQIYGIDRQQGRSLSVVLFKPNGSEALGKFPAKVQSPGKPNYEMSIRANGRYLLRVFRDRDGSLFPVRTNPSQRLINCNGSVEITNADFALQ